MASLNPTYRSLSKMVTLILHVIMMIIIIIIIIIIISLY